MGKDAIVNNALSLKSGLNFFIRSNGKDNLYSSIIIQL